MEVGKQPQIRLEDIKSLPIKMVEDKRQLPFIKIANYILNSKRNNNIIHSLFFELIIDALVYELYFPEDIRMADCELQTHLVHLSELKDYWSDSKKQHVIEEAYYELSDPKHPVSIAMLGIKQIPEVKIIEGSGSIN